MPRKGWRKQRHVVGDPTDPQGFAAALKRFVDHLVIKNYSPRTVEIREYHVFAFMAWCDERGVHVTSIRVFFKWLARENLIPCHPASEMDVPSGAVSRRPSDQFGFHVACPGMPEPGGRGCVSDRRERIFRPIDLRI